MLSSHLPKPADEFVGPVRQAITTSLPEGGDGGGGRPHAPCERAYSAAEIDGRGTSFRDGCDATRRGLARGYLSDPTVSISETAFLTGFRDQASFTRAFRRWTGAPPGAWRKRGYRCFGVMLLLLGGG